MSQIRLAADAYKVNYNRIIVSVRHEIPVQGRSLDQIQADIARVQAHAGDEEVKVWYEQPTVGSMVMVIAVKALEDDDQYATRIVREENELNDAIAYDRKLARGLHERYGAIAWRDSRTELPVAADGFIIVWHKDEIATASVYDTINGPVVDCQDMDMIWNITNDPIDELFQAWVPKDGPHWL